jgi:hypothetical protein
MTAGKPACFTYQDGLFMRAIELGCTPVITALGWKCECRGAQHGACTSYPMLNTTSLERFRSEL